MTSIRDVAKRAGVSVSTVSHVINNTRHVEPETAVRVRQAITELAYHPNAAARSLRSGQTHTIGLMVPDNSNPFFAEIARVIEDEGFRAGYSVILCNSDGSNAKENAYVDVLLSKQVDGLIFISSSNGLQNLKRVLNAKTPVVVVDREVHDSAVSQILVDNWHGGYLAGQYLLELGHRHFAMITGYQSTTPSAQRQLGFNQVLHEANIILDPKQVVSGDFRFEGGKGAASQLVNAGLNFSALFAANDLMAMGALTALHAAGVRVPQDVSVIGFDNIPYAQTTVPPLTTIAQPIEEIGKCCIEVLLQQIRMPDAPVHQDVLLPSLVIRESCIRVADSSPVQY